jgi:hypothetical protein
MTMTNHHELSVFTNPDAIKNVVSHISTYDEPLIVTQTASVSEYVSTVFNGADQSDIYIRNDTRPAGGIGPHFDVYDEHVSPEFPFIGTFNLQGRAILKATWLSEELQNYYDTTYPVRTELAKAARRPLAQLALLQPGAEVYDSNIASGVGLVIPQMTEGAQGRYIVHDIVPERTISLASKFIRPYKFNQAALPITERNAHFQKFVVPRDTDDAREAVINEGYIPYDQYIERRDALVASERNEYESQERVRKANENIRRTKNRQRVNKPKFD